MRRPPGRAGNALAVAERRAWNPSGSTATPSVISISAPSRGPWCAPAPTVERSPRRSRRWRCAARRRSASSAPTAWPRRAAPAASRVARRRPRAFAPRRPTAVNWRGRVDRVLDAAPGDMLARGAAHPRGAARRDAAHRARRDRPLPGARKSSRTATPAPSLPAATAPRSAAFVAAHRAGKKLARLRRRDAPALAGRRLTMFECARRGVPCTLISTARPRSRCSARRSTRWSSAPTGSRATATPPTRSARTASRSSRRITASRSTSRRRARRSTSRSRSGARDPDRGAQCRRGRRRSARTAEDARLQPGLRRHAGRADHRHHHRVRRDPRRRTPTRFPDLETRPQLCRAGALVKFYDFLERRRRSRVGRSSRAKTRARPARAGRVLDRLLPADMRALNCDVSKARDRVIGRVGRRRGQSDAVLGRAAGRGRAQLRRPCGRNRGAICGRSRGGSGRQHAGARRSLRARKKTKPEPFGAQAGRKATRIDTTPNAEVRERFVRETLERLGAKAAAAGDRGAGRAATPTCGAIQNDLEKLALGGRTITIADLERESLSVEDPKAWQYASAVVEGRPADALAIAFELFANDPRGAAVPLASALAGEFALLWELARPGGGALPARHRWRERILRPIARRVGERRARNGYEAAVRGFEAVVTGRIDDPRGDDRAADRRSGHPARFLALDADQRIPARARPTSRSDRGVAAKAEPASSLASAASRGPSRMRSLLARLAVLGAFAVSMSACSNGVAGRRCRSRARPTAPAATPASCRAAPTAPRCCASSKARPTSARSTSASTRASRRRRLDEDRLQEATYRAS